MQYAMYIVVSKVTYYGIIPMPYVTYTHQQCMLTLDHMDSTLKFYLMLH